MPRHRPRPFSNTLVFTAGLGLSVAAVPVFIMPIPLGAVVIISGVLMLLKVSPRARLLRRNLVGVIPS